MIPLTETSKNPLPPNPVTGMVRTPDQIGLRYARWRTDRPPSKGTVVMLQGRAEYIEKAFETVADLRGEGFDVLCFDWRGQGGSERMLEDPARGYVDDFDQYIMDLETIFDQIALPDCRPPFFILGHSTGALVALLATQQMGNRFKRMVLCSPLAGLGEGPIPPGAVKALSTTLAIVGLGEIYLAGGRDMMARRSFAGNMLTTDLARFERNSEYTRLHPELTIGGPTAAWVSAMSRAVERLDDPEFIGQIGVPTLLVAAGNDRVVSNRAIERLGYRMRSGSTLTIAGARHELLQEADIFREQLLAAIYTFFPGGDDLSPADQAEAG